MTKTGLRQFLIWATKNTHCTFSRYAGFSQIQSHIYTLIRILYLICWWVEHDVFQLILRPVSPEMALISFRPFGTTLSHFLLWQWMCLPRHGFADILWLGHWNPIVLIHTYYARTVSACDRIRTSCFPLFHTGTRLGQWQKPFIKPSINTSKFCLDAATLCPMS